MSSPAIQFKGSGFYITDYPKKSSADSGTRSSGDKPAENGPAGVPGKKKEVEGIFVYKNGRASFLQVTTGIKGDQDIEITSGLDEGLEIITGPYKTLRTLKDGDQIRKEVKPATPEAK